MKFLIFSFLMAFCKLLPGHNDCMHVQEVRALFEKGIESKEELKHMFEICNQYPCEQITPYLSAATMKQAEFTWSPIKQYRFFNQGKNMLEKHIETHPNTIEGRYIRWLIQTMAPKFLIYRQNIDEDYQFIIQNIERSQLTQTTKQNILTRMENIKNNE